MKKIPTILSAIVVVLVVVAAFFYYEKDRKHDFLSAVDKIDSFLEKNQAEIVYVKIQRNYTDDEVDIQKTFFSIRPNGLGKKLIHRPGLALLQQEANDSGGLFKVMTSTYPQTPASVSPDGKRFVEAKHPEGRDYIRLFKDGKEWEITNDLPSKYTNWKLPFYAYAVGPWLPDNKTVLVIVYERSEGDGYDHGIWALNTDDFTMKLVVPADEGGDRNFFEFGQVVDDERFLYTERKNGLHSLYIIQFDGTGKRLLDSSSSEEIRVVRVQ